jgi:hypothetical protein
VPLGVIEKVAVLQEEEEEDTDGELSAVAVTIGEVVLDGDGNAELDEDREATEV